MNSIILYDTEHTGHHSFYNNILLNNLKLFYKTYFFTGDCRYKNNDIEYKVFYNKWRNKLFKILYHIKNILFTLVFAKYKKVKLIHFTCFDEVVVPLFLLLSIIAMFKFKIVITVHWTSKNNIKIAFIKRIMGYKNIIMLCHGEYIKSQYVKLGIDENKIFITHYPIKEDLKVYEKVFARKKLDLPLDKSILLFFGGSRFDKGLDLLIDAVKNLKNIFVLVAGKEQYFKKSDLMKKIYMYGLQTCFRWDEGFIGDTFMGYYYSACDIVVLPYRKIFGGESGCLLDAVAFNKPIIGPNIGQLYFNISKYSLGLIFEAENIEDLREKIIESIYAFKFNSDNSNYTSFKSIHSIQNFVQTHIKIYEEL